MSNETTFTRIVAGDLPGYTVYEDDTTYGFLDANPVAPGHTLVIPREPYERFQELPPHIAADLTRAVQELVPAIEAAVGADASTLVLSNGPAAGQEIPHVHWHVVPQFEDETNLVEYRPMLDGHTTDSEMESIAAAIRDER